VEGLGEFHHRGTILRRERQPSVQVDIGQMAPCRPFPDRVVAKRSAHATVSAATFKPWLAKRDDFCISSEFCGVAMQEVSAAMMEINFAIESSREP
jgi:hypothetical protein